MQPLDVAPAAVTSDRRSSSIRLPRNAAVAILAAAVVLGWLLVGAVHSREPAVSGSQIGTLFGQVSLAAAWFVLASSTLSRRMLIAACWLGGIAVAIAALMSPDEVSIALYAVVAGSVLGLWLLVQMPLWPLALRYGWQLRHRDDGARLALPADRQIGIRQILLLTTIVAGVLATVRGLIATGALNEPGWQSVLVNVGFIAVCSALAAQPLILAGLATRRRWLAILSAIVLIAVLTPFEAQIYARLSGPASTIEYVPIIAKNVVQCLWLLGGLLLLNVGGYRLVSRPDLLSP